MVAIINYNLYNQEKYLKYLSLVGALSGLFSDSAIPHLHYRATENIYCDVFKANNLSRADVSVDAKLNEYGIGIKTFRENNRKTLQKIAEFNRESSIFNNLKDEEKIYKISQLRNNRLDFTKSAYGVNKLIYHCIVRNTDGFYLYEESMDNINIDNITNINYNDSSIVFEDGIHEYRFNKSKSTLFKRFYTDNYFANIKVNIIDDPMTVLKDLNISVEEPEVVQTVVLPLYSDKKGEKYIYEKSGLNQWNAGGRTRHPDEVYIHHPHIIREEFDTFFPDRMTPFNVLMPNGEILKMKVCQENGKAIMSDPNRALGSWILRDVLKVPPSTLVTYEMLLEVGIDCVIFQKIGDMYKLDFKAVGEYEKFLQKSEII